MSISIRLVTVIGVLEVTEVFLTSEIGTIAQRAEASGAFVFSLGRKSIPTALQEVRKIPPVLIGGTHLHEIASNPLIRMVLHLIGCTDTFKSLVGKGFKSLFV